MKVAAYKASLGLAALALIAIGILRDPDMGGADGVNAVPSLDHLPGYQCITNAQTYAPLSASELQALNTQGDDVLATF